jgi:hypothetical protein
MVTECSDVFLGDQQSEHGISLQCSGECFCLHHHGVLCIVLKQDIVSASNDTTLLAKTESYMDCWVKEPIRIWLHPNKFSRSQDLF